jgi:hypothetical protein
VKAGHYSDEALRHHSWAFAAVSAKQTNLVSRILSLSLEPFLMEYFSSYAFANPTASMRSLLYNTYVEFLNRYRRASKDLFLIVTGLYQVQT